MHTMPFVRVELCVFAVVQRALSVLLIRREEIPERGKWALPGGALRVDLDHSLEEAAVRVARERLRAPLPSLRQHCAVGGTNRDARGPGRGWALSVVYRAVLRSEMFTPEPGKRVTDITWMPVEIAESARELAFDHGGIVASATAALRREVEALQLPFDLIEVHFSLPDLQQLCEAVLARPLDKSSFRRRLADARVVEPVEGIVRRGPNRPAQIYRARPIK
jgi:8-oxo-dGTP diphosphatase